MQILHKKLTRRIILAWGVVGFIPNISWGRLILNKAIISPDINSRMIAANLVKAAFSDPSSALRLGELYMHSVPEGQDLNSLVSALIENNSVLAAKVADNEKKAIYDALQWQIIKDFENGEVVNIDGWVVAHTEARLSALTNFI